LGKGELIRDGFWAKAAKNNLVVAKAISYSKKKID